MKVLGIIPARGGSKSIPLKNVKPLNGKPLIEYTIETALDSEVLDRIAISTDHDQIIKVCKKYKGIDIIRRPAELATDEARTEGALIHVCDEIERNDGFIPDVVLTLEPTSPLRSKETILRCIEIFEETDADSVIGLTETRACYGKIVNGKFQFLFPGQPRRRQDREPLYRESSTIYGTKLTTLREKNSVLGDNLFPLLIPPDEAIDINDERDFEMVEVKLAKRTPHEF